MPLDAETRADFTAQVARFVEARLRPIEAKVAEERRTVEAIQGRYQSDLVRIDRAQAALDLWLNEIEAKEAS